MTRQTLTCPEGHRFPMPRVAYGLPAPEAMQGADEGRIVLAGDPTFPPEITCPICGLVVSELVSGDPREPDEPPAEEPIRT